MYRYTEFDRQFVRLDVGLQPGDGRIEFAMLLPQRRHALRDAGQFGGIGRLVHAPSLARPPVSVMTSARR